jgi:hypothetical protein
MKEINIDKIDEYTVKELQEYITANDHAPKKIHIKVEEEFLGIYITNIMGSIIGMFAVYNELNLSGIFGLMLSYLLFLGSLGLIEFIMYKIYKFLAKIIEIEIT